MFQVTKLSKSYGKQVLFDDVTFTVGDGERVGLVGRNGHGKTTLFRILTGAEEVDSGEIHTPADYRIGYLSQHLSFSKQSALAEVASELPQQKDWIETHRAEAILSGLGFSEGQMHEDPKLLSGGFQVRLNLAKVIVSEPNLLLLDEPTNYLDIVSMRWLAQ
ncbi:MAG: ABC-F family ATP-binding cassette domain-containing protein, partial [Bdellovibrionales bacterium]|nr:ABC-F family ATP-binding cassette domain-containing protein [Bdellovibrionales bacterium]